MRTQAENEAFVRGHWGWFRMRFSEPYEGYAQGVHVIEIPGKKFSHQNQSVALASAAEFTEQRMEEIQNVVDEIASITALLDEYKVIRPRWERILAREQAALESLKKGWIA